jgi:hypothetical protein
MNYQQLIQDYQQRNKAFLADGITIAFSHVDEVSVSLGLLEDSGLLAEILDTISVALPFAVIAVTEQGNVVLKKKTQKAALQDGSYRMLKTGAGMAAGAVAMAAGLGALPAIPIAVGVRMMLDKYRGSMLIAYRVRQRTQRLIALREAQAARRNTRANNKNSN